MKLLQLNVTANWGSTGKIAEGIGQAAMARGWESYIAYGRYMNPSQSQLIKVGNKFDVYTHYARNRFLDGEGLGSKSATKEFVRKVEELSPDIIHLHNIHDHWLNYPVLFDYLARVDIPVIWTFHDCWAFTGGCAHFVLSGCEQWKTNCQRCPFPKHKLRREAFNHRSHIENFSLLNERLTIVSVSSWLNSLVGQSRLGNHRHTYIYNGIDLNIFKPSNPGSLLAQYGISGKKVLLGVSSVWPEYKGLKDYIELSRLLDDSYRIVLIGLPKKLHKDLPSGIIPIERTQELRMLVYWYSAATAVLSLSKAETFGMTLAEGLACGTPSVGYADTAIKEIIHPNTGIGVEPGDIVALKDAVEFIAHHPEAFPQNVCRSRSLEKYDKDTQYGKYINLYEDLLQQK